MPEYLTLAEAAALAGVDYSTVWRWVNRGVLGHRLPAQKQYRKVYTVHSEEFEQFLKETEHGRRL